MGVTISGCIDQLEYAFFVAPVIRQDLVSLLLRDRDRVLVNSKNRKDDSLNMLLSCSAYQPALPAVSLDHPRHRVETRSP